MAMRGTPKTNGKKIGDRDLSRLWAFQPDGSVVGSRIDDPIRSYWASAAIDMR